MCVRMCMCMCVCKIPWLSISLCLHTVSVLLYIFIDSLWTFWPGTLV